MNNCDHDWKELEFTNFGDTKMSIERICQKCGLKQKREYQGDNMWKWVQMNSEGNTVNDIIEEYGRK